MEAQKEHFEFQSEARRVLDLMINSVYSDPDIFLRELISNASDAIDKLRIEGLSDESIRSEASDPRISIKADRTARTLTIEDNGVGMSRDELTRFLGTVAKSGTGEFLESAHERAEGLIGRFGVGFYSSFIVASRVTVDTRRAGTSEAWLWDSTGDGTYTIEPGSRKKCGTTIVLHLKEAVTTEDQTPKDYLSDFTLRSMIKRWSDFVSHPIYLGDDKEPVNSMKALWTRPESEVTDEEYNEFYSHISHDWEDPLERIVYRAEGTNEFHALLFIPSRPPFDLYFNDGTRGVQLYIKRVFIMNDCSDLLPEYLRFVRGVVDSEDLPLNVSREILQQDVHTARIKRGVTRKVLDALRKMKADRPDDYAKFWKAFGAVLKEGIVREPRDRDAIMKLCLFETTTRSGITLDEYVAGMKEGADKILYIAGGEHSALAKSPKLEAFRKAGVEVLILSDPVDEFWTAAAGEFSGKKFVSVSTDEVEIPSAGEDEAEQAQDDVAKKIHAAMSGLGGVADVVDEVRMSRRLVDSPATFSQKGPGMTPQMRAMMRAMGQEAPTEHRVLELNPSHALIRKIAVDDIDIKDAAALLLGLAQIADGEQVDDPARFTAIISRLACE